MTEHHLFDDSPERCPVCGSREPLPLVYGAPSAEMLIAAKLGQIALGDPASPDGSAQWACRSRECRREF